MSVISIFFLWGMNFKPTVHVAISREFHLSTCHKYIHACEESCFAAFDGGCNDLKITINLGIQEGLELDITPNIKVLNVVDIK